MCAYTCVLNWDEASKPWTKLHLHAPLTLQEEPIECFSSTGLCCSIVDVKSKMIINWCRIFMQKDQVSMSMTPILMRSQSLCKHVNDLHGSRTEVLNGSLCRWPPWLVRFKCALELALATFLKGGFSLGSFQSCCCNWRGAAAEALMQQALCACLSLA